MFQLLFLELLLLLFKHLDYEIVLVSHIVEKIILLDNEFLNHFSEDVVLVRVWDS